MTLPALGAFFAPVRDTPDHIRLAEDLGFTAAWVYDSPLLYHDPYTTLARAAERTTSIALGVGVVVPGLRAPTVTASALRSVSALAPGRVRLALGAGFTGRFTFGLPPVSLRRLEREARDVRALLAGDEAAHHEGGKPVRLIPAHGAGGDASVPIYIACRGVKAQALAGRVGDGAMTGIFYPGGLSLLKSGIGANIPLVAHAIAAVADPGEPLDSPRLTEAVGPVVAVAFHMFTEQPWRLEGLDPALRSQAEDYVRRVNERLPGGRRHQELHRGHLTELVLPEDREVVTADNVRRFAFCGTGPDLRRRAEGLAADGVTELALHPGGDVPGELHRLAAALR
ncbi:MAG TPA: LLM class flavin-dependent oxidoreductase [Methylomirabilota bacterium]|nr:LLM class flavin-dependent oxidoreductase [Methylomirabilota bacterium]